MALTPMAFLFLDGDDRIVRFNNAAAKLFGCTAAEAVGNSLADLIIPKQYRDFHRKGLSDYVNGDSKGNYLGTKLTVMLLRKDGEIFKANIKIRPIGNLRNLFCAYVCALA